MAMKGQVTINEYGILVDLQMVENAITFDERSKATISNQKSYIRFPEAIVDT